ncbi:MAG: ATP-binding protein [Rivularia sp. (in: cyanobacteria)]
MTATINNQHDVSATDLFAVLTKVRQCLENYIGREGSRDRQEGQAEIISCFTFPTPLTNLCRIFQLSDFERDILVMCCGMALDAEWENLCATANNDSRRDFPTFNLALKALPAPDWSALSPMSPLRKWHLIEVGEGNSLTTSALRIDERILHYLMGIQHGDEKLLRFVVPLKNSQGVNTKLVDSHQQLAEQVAATWGNSPLHYPVIQLCGDEITSKRTVAAAACQLIECDLCIINACNLPQNNQDFHEFLQLWEREAALNNLALLLDCDEIDSSDHTLDNAVKSIIERLENPLIITTRDRLSPKQRTILTFDVYKPTINEQRIIWKQALDGELGVRSDELKVESKELGVRREQLNILVDTLVSQFNLTAPEIFSASHKAFASKVTSDNSHSSSFSTLNSSLLTPNSPVSTPNSSLLTPNSPLSLLWESCRAQARPRLDDLAQRIIPSATWDDIVLPESQIQTLQSVAAHVRQRMKVYEKWGFAGKGERGLGISALFAGVSGTGKTMSAEVLAQELQLDLYRIDLSAVVSKYIGETEKNLRRVFDAAEAGATILLFDEADALFGKRSEVKDSRDRYANMEVSYLLQRMETYQGLAVLTTNLKDSIDTAFLRRIRFIVKFAFPDIPQREEIWRRVFPKNTPTEGLDFTKLAKLNVAGGNIRNIALNAAFVAADAGEAVGMKHIKVAAHSEYTKLERTLTDAEVRGWV